MTATAATLRTILARLPIDELTHRALAAEYRAIAVAHDAVADAFARGPESTPIPDTLPAPPIEAP